MNVVQVINYGDLTDIHPVGEISSNNDVGVSFIFAFVQKKRKRLDFDFQLLIKPQFLKSFK